MGEKSRAKCKNSSLRTHCKGRPSLSDRRNSTQQSALEGSAKPRRYPSNHTENSVMDIKRRLSLFHGKIHRSSRLKLRFSGMKAGQ